MTKKEAIEYGKKWDEAIESRGDTPFSEARQFLSLAIKALDLLIRLEGFKYVTTDVMLKEHELAHFDVYKTGWNDAIEAVKVASDRPLQEIFNAIKETEAYSEYKEAEE